MGMVWRAAWLGLMARFPWRQEATAREEHLRLRLEDAKARIKDMEFESDRLRSLTKLQELELVGLTHVNERNLQRTNAETSEWVRRAALAGIPAQKY